MNSPTQKKNTLAFRQCEGEGILETGDEWVFI